MFSACWNRKSKTSNDFEASTGIWHHFVVVFQAHDDMRHYWNGMALDGHCECFGSGMTYSNADGAIGHNISPTGDRYVKAAIDDIRVYSRALSEAEILDLFTELPVGHLDYCRDVGPCAEGEGDCDSDSECQSGLTCVQVTGTDTCQQPVCPPLGDLDYCLACGPCAEGEGDCYIDSECAGDLICDFMPGTDYCRVPATVCGLPVGDADYCRVCGPCTAGQGDCDSNSECQSGLSCVFVPGTDVCCPHPLGHLDYCRDCGQCAAGQGDCYSDSECQNGLTCVFVPGTDTCQ